VPVDSNLPEFIPEDPDALRQYLSAIPLDNVELILHVSSLLKERFSIHGASEDLDSAVTCLRNGIQFIGNDSLFLPYLHGSLGSSLSTRFNQSGERADLGEAIKSYQQAAGLIPVDDSLLPLWLNNLAFSLASRFHRYGEDMDLEQAIKNYRQAIEFTPTGDSELQARLGNLAFSLESRFRRYGEDVDLAQAITNYRQAIELTPVGHSDLPSLLSNLAFLLLSRFRRYREDEDLERAITTYRHAIELTPAGHRDLPLRLSNLAVSLESKFQRYGEDADLEEAITNFWQAVELTPLGHSDLPTRLNNLAASLDSRFDRYGADADLEQAIANYRKAIELTPVGHSDLPLWLNNLALSLVSRFRRYREDEDLEHAITNYRRAIELTPVGHISFPLRLNNLAISLASRFDRHAEDADLEHAITKFQQVIELTPVGHTELPSGLSNLALSLVTRFRRYGEDADLELAIANYRRAMELTPVGHISLPLRLNNLALSLVSRFNRYGEDADLEHAITNYKRAIESTPTGHSHLPLCLNNLANSLASRFARYRDGADLNSAISEYVKGSEARGGLTRLRFRCAFEGAAFAHSSGYLPEALRLYSTAGSLLPRLIWFGQSVASRQRLLRSHGTNLASDAAACAVSVGFLEKAVELLDHGRSIFWSQAMDIRTTLIDLRNSDASLAGEFENVARALDAGAFQDQESDFLTTRGQESILNNTEQRRRLAEELERLLLRIRKLPGFHNFMEPLPFSQLRRAAAGGPIIILNVSSYRCDALIVAVDRPPKLVPLPDLSLDRVSDLAANIRKYQNRQGQDPHAFRSCLKAVLPEIWRTTVSPVLSALGLTDSQERSETLPRMWWCPTGPLSFLPIHAAGPYSKSGEPSLMYRVVSSYTNTLSALLRARDKHRSTESCQMLLIGQAETPGQKPLSATEDLDVICGMARSRGVVTVTRLEGPDAVVDTILEKLDDATCVHFACHGHQDQTRNGLISALYVHDGKLLLPTLASRQLSRADFAFLSACHSASGSDDMPDEAMHLAAGMQVAGFRSVIATMWAMDDRTGPFVAERVYDRLLRDALDKFDSTLAAVSLNDAVRALRKVKDAKGNPKYDVDQWVPFIHIGV
jgi:tetratricopeptide (TPR) repeat protein